MRAGSAADPSNLLGVIPAKGGTMNGALVFAGGDPLPHDLAERLDRDRFVIAADSGLDHALALGFHADLLVGDLDSVDPAALRTAYDRGTIVERHPEQKDSTDLELALDAAVAHDVRRVTVVGGNGGRLDHLIANALLLAAPRFATLEIDALLPPARVAVVRRTVTLLGSLSELCTLVPVGGPADGVRTSGLHFPLDGERLEPGSTRGVSNVFVETTATVTLDSGILLAIQPEALEF
jgi:thiamine pyrophosphokinase